MSSEMCDSGKYVIPLTPSCDFGKNSPIEIIINNYCTCKHHKKHHRRHHRRHHHKCEKCRKHHKCDKCKKRDKCDKCKKNDKD